MKRLLSAAAASLALVLVPLSSVAAMKCMGDACTAISVEDHYVTAGKVKVNSAIFTNRGRETVIVGYSTLLGSKGCAAMEQQQVTQNVKTPITTPMCGDDFKAYFYSTIYGKKR